MPARVADRRHRDRAWLQEQYSTLGRSASNIASEVGCCENNILYALAKFRIPRRTVAEARKIKHWGPSGRSNPMFGRTGETNPNWKGGVTPERQRIYSGFAWKQVNRSVRSRDGDVCIRCRSAEELETHHVASWEDRPDLRMVESNLVTLCARCHRWVHGPENQGRAYLP